MRRRFISILIVVAVLLLILLPMPALADKERFVIEAGQPAIRYDDDLWVRVVGFGGKELARWPNVWTTERFVYASDNCLILPGTLRVSEDGVVGEPDDAAIEAFEHAGQLAAYLSDYGIEFDVMVATVHCGVPTLLGCSQSNAAFWPRYDQILYGDGDGGTYGSFVVPDVSYHEWQHRVTYHTVRWSDGDPRGLDYRDESGALNEAYSDLVACLITEDWCVGEEIRLDGQPMRCLDDPGRTDHPSHYSQYRNNGTQSWRVHYNATIPGHAAYLMAREMGADRTIRVWLEALKRMRGDETFTQARNVMLAVCDEWFPEWTTTVQNAWADVGIGNPAEPPEPTPTPTATPTCTPLPTFTPTPTLTVTVTPSPTACPTPTPTETCPLRRLFRYFFPWIQQR